MISNNSDISKIPFFTIHRGYPKKNFSTIPSLFQMFSGNFGNALGDTMKENGMCHDGEEGRAMRSLPALIQRR